MMRCAIILLAVSLLSGCEGLNEMVVRQMFIDHGLSRDMNRRIRQRLEEKSTEHPPAATPSTPAPPFLDRG